MPAPSPLAFVSIVCFSITLQSCAASPPRVATEPVEQARPAPAETSEPAHVAASSESTEIVAADPLPCHDEALGEAAAALLLELRDSRAPSSAAIVRALREAGSSLPSARVFVARPDRTQAATWLAAHERAVDSRGESVCGEAIGRWRVVLQAERLGRIVAREDALELEWARGLPQPYLVLLDERGAPAAYATEGNGRMRFPLDAPVLRAQLVADTDEGPRPIASWGRQALPPLPPAATPEQRLARLREGIDVGGLRANRLLAHAAERHAMDVCENRRARHAFDSWPQERMHQLGLRARHLGEAVARASSVDQALEALAASPSHRMALVDRRFTDIGVGVDRRHGDACVVVFLAAWPQAIGGIR